MKRVLLTGAGGFLGSRILAQLGGCLDLVPVPRGLMETTDEKSLARLVRQVHPDAILHTAALSDTGVL